MSQNIMLLQGNNRPTMPVIELSWTHVFLLCTSTCIYTRASTCIQYTCQHMYYIHVLHTTPNLCQTDRLATVSFFQHFWSFVTDIRTSMLPKKFMVGLNPIETTLTLTLTSVEAISEQSWPCLIWLQFIYLQMDHIMPPPPDFDLVRKKKSLTLLKPTYFKPYVCKDFVGFPQKTSQ